MNFDEFLTRIAWGHAVEASDRSEGDDSYSVLSCVYWWVWGGGGLLQDYERDVPTRRSKAIRLNTPLNKQTAAASALWIRRPANIADLKKQNSGNLLCTVGVLGLLAGVDRLSGGDVFC